MIVDDLEIKEVSFTRKFNLGNYETEDLSLTATVKKGQSVDDVFSALDAYTIKYRKGQKKERS